MGNPSGKQQQLPEAETLTADSWAQGANRCAISAGSGDPVVALRFSASQTEHINSVTAGGRVQPGNQKQGRRSGTYFRCGERSLCGDI